MPRFDSLRYSLPDARRILRDRLRRYLPVSTLRGRQQRPASRVSDESVVTLLRGLTIQFGNDADTARQRYDAARGSFPTAPPFDDLIRAGLVRPVWGRISTPLDTARLLGQQPDDLRQALLPALAARHERTVEVGAEASKDPAVNELAQQLASDSPNWASIHSPAPAWVAARLWERTPDGLTTGIARLRFWLDRWQLLHGPAVIAGTAWDAESARAFTEAALSALAIEPGFLGWSDLRSHLVARMALASNHPAPDIEIRVAQVPSTMFDRVRWLDDRGFEHVRDDHDACADLWGVARLLLAEVADVDMSVAPHPLATQLLDLAAEKPELLDFIALAAHQQPVVLADLLLHPRLCAVACMLIAKWPSAAGAWDRETVAQDDDSARLSAFTDAVGVLGHFLEARATAPGEGAALLTWMHSAATNWRTSYQQPVVNARTMAAIRAELLRLPLDVLRAIYDSLATGSGGLDTPAFAATMDVLALGALSDSVEPSGTVDRYLRSVRSLDYSVSASRMEPASTRALVQLAARSGDERWRSFLAPLDVRGALAGAGPADAFTVTDGLARSLRAHIRVLARAIAAWPDTPPSDVVAALAANIRSGAVSHAERGRVPALGARFEVGPVYGPSERPVAFDLGDALGALADSAREQVLAAILECDEPMTLAQLLTVAPATTRERIKGRIAQLTPQEAGGIWSLPEAQGRVDALLSAGLAEAAASFIDAERDLGTLGKVPGRNLARLRAQLRLHLLREELEVIESTVLPADLDPAEQTEGAETLQFYKALAQLSVPTGDAERARQAFEGLHRRRPDVAAYVVNLLAAEASILLAGNLFVLLQGPNVSRARRALAAADLALSQCRVVSDEDRAIHECNRALLLLATGEPDRAQAVLSTVASAQRAERVAAYAAVALSRMGRPDEALAAIDVATQAFGSTDLLQAAKGQIRGGVPFDARASATSIEDPIPGLKAALSDIAALDPFRQAQVFQPPPDPFDNLLINHVREAAASIVALVPMMKSVELDSREDDLSALVRELLLARLGFLHWSVGDQSKGGFSEKGNPGERDMVVRKGGAVLTVLEAVVCDRPATNESTKRKLTSHFQKLLGYSTCRLFFHLTYSYVTDPGSVVAELKREAQALAPTGFAFTGAEDLPLTDARPTGFVASYRASLGEVRVVFLVLDMQQQAQRDAAATAAGNTPTRPKS